MGNQLCKSTPENYHLAVAPDIPELSEPIKAYIKENKPFQAELNNQKNKTYKNYPDGIYDGPLNMVGLKLSVQMNNPGGFGKLYKNDGSVYIGQFSNGKANGKGVLLYPNGSHASGFFENNMFQKGQYVSQGFKYVGEFKNNIFHGEGQETNAKDGYDFQGTFNEGRKIQGSMKWRKDKIQYIYEGKFNENGDFVDGGKLTEETIGHYLGEYKNNRKHGKGVYEYKNGIKYEGQYVDGSKEGYGKLFNGDGSMSYEGYFKNGLPHGTGKAYSKDGKAVEANWVQGINQQLILA